MTIASWFPWTRVVHLVLIQLLLQLMVLCRCLLLLLEQKPPLALQLVCPSHQLLSLNFRCPDSLFQGNDFQLELCPGCGQLKLSVLKSLSSLFNF